jgi:hypothetical protein
MAAGTRSTAGPPWRDQVTQDCVADLSLADVESAKPSAAFMANVIADKKARQRRGP